MPGIWQWATRHCGVDSKKDRHSEKVIPRATNQRNRSQLRCGPTGFLPSTRVPSVACRVSHSLLEWGLRGNSLLGIGAP